MVAKKDKKVTISVYLPVKLLESIDKLRESSKSDDRIERSKLISTLIEVGHIVYREQMRNNERIQQKFTILMSRGVDVTRVNWDTIDINKVVSEDALKKEYPSFISPSQPL